MIVEQFFNDEIDYLTFINSYKPDTVIDRNKLIGYLEKALSTKEAIKVEVIVDIIDWTETASNYIDELNHLLIDPRHESHQSVARLLQFSVGSPSSLPYIREVLTSGFGFLAYTCSENNVIAKWFSHLLWSINTDEAIAMIHEFSNSKDPGIAEEMRYRLTRIKTVTGCK